MDDHLAERQNVAPKFQVTLYFQATEAFIAKVPEHRSFINDLINKGIIDSYTISMETMRGWIVMNGESKDQIADILSKSPLFSFLSLEIDLLFVVDGLSYRLPALQLN
jgi:hypothetical protein